MTQLINCCVNCYVAIIEGGWCTQMKMSIKICEKKTQNTSHNLKMHRPGSNFMPHNSLVMVVLVLGFFFLMYFFHQSCGLTNNPF